MQGYESGWYWLRNLVFTVDLAVAVLGYGLSLKVLDNHTRTAEPSFLGWFVALQCYYPFWSGMFEPNFLKYDDDGHNFFSHLQARPQLAMALGVVVLLLLTAYSLATVNFGLRFSNLTNRGIITNGMYAITKHPAYVTKNLSWWLFSLPWIHYAGASEALRHCLLLAGVNFIYFLRARTEERHLSMDPDYVQYALAMNERSWLAFLGRLIPYFKYDPARYTAYAKDGTQFFAAADDEQKADRPAGG
jgi:protein-S-isoprenylcysteine O-methyltransferase Ste14